VSADVLGGTAGFTEVGDAAQEASIEKSASWNDPRRIVARVGFSITSA
jgi:hypothetical protein